MNRLLNYELCGLHIWKFCSFARVSCTWLTDWEHITIAVTTDRPETYTISYTMSLTLLCFIRKILVQGIQLKKSNKCLPMHTNLAFPPLFYRRSLTHAVFVTQNAFQIFFTWQKYSWGLRRWVLRGGGGGRKVGGRKVGATMETYMTHIGLYIALLFNYCTDVIHFGGQNISTWLAQILYALILKELNMSHYRPMKIILVK